MASQHEQALRGRMIRFTLKRPGTYSSSSVTSSPRVRRVPPHRTAIIARRQFLRLPDPDDPAKACGCAGASTSRHPLSGWRVGLRLCRLDDLGVLLQVETELVETFGFAAKAMAVGAVKLVLKLLDLEAQRLHLVGQKTVHRLQLGGVFRGGYRDLSASPFHTTSRIKRESLKRSRLVFIALPNTQRAPRPVGHPPVYALQQHGQLRRRDRNLAILGCWPNKPPFSSRLLKRHAPWASHQIIFNRSPRRPRNTNRWPE